MFAKEAAYGQSKVPTIVGEWSLYTESEIVKTEDQAVRKAFYRGLAEASIEAFSSCEGWFYWSYKTHLDDPVWDCWDLGKCMSNGWMPEKL